MYIYIYINIYGGILQIWQDYSLECSYPNTKGTWIILFRVAHVWKWSVAFLSLKVLQKRNSNWFSGFWCAPTNIQKRYTDREIYTKWVLVTGTPSDRENISQTGSCFCQFLIWKYLAKLFLDTRNIKLLILYSIYILMGKKMKYHFGWLLFESNFGNLGIKIILPLKGLNE